MKGKRSGGKNRARGRSVLEMDCTEARRFFLKPTSYWLYELPQYIRFENVLSAVDAVLPDGHLRGITTGPVKPSDCEGVNHRLNHNKDGKLAWRPLEFIHPVLYVSLVRTITEPDAWKLICERFAEFRKPPGIRSASIPVESGGKRSDTAEQVLTWWETVEQASLETALEHDCMVSADVADCYGSVNSHALAYALHGREAAKRDRSDRTLLGSKVEEHIRDMRGGKANGIPQGSVLMDFLAELFLGYADTLLQERLESASFRGCKVVRYRDDYRIFACSVGDCETVLRELSEVLAGMGLSLNHSKTVQSTSVITGALKPDKLAWVCEKRQYSKLQDELLAIHAHGASYPNSGSVRKALSAVAGRLAKKARPAASADALVSIVADIGVRNPRSFPLCAAIISALLDSVSDKKERVELLTRVAQKLSRVPNNGYMEIWLQRVTAGHKMSVAYDEALCRKVAGQSVAIWNSSWLENEGLRKAVEETEIVDKGAVKKLSKVIPLAEVDQFWYEY